MILYLSLKSDDKAVPCAMCLRSIEEITRKLKDIESDLKNRQRKSNKDYQYRDPVLHNVQRVHGFVSLSHK